MENWRMLVPIGLFSWARVAETVFHLSRCFTNRDRARHSGTWMTTVKSSRAKKGALSLMSEISTLTMVVEDKAGTPVSRALMAKE